MYNRNSFNFGIVPKDKRAQELVEQVRKVRQLLNTNKISYEEAREMVKPYADYVNSKSKKIAKKYN